MSRGPVAPPPAKGEGVVMVMLPPLWDVGWTVEVPIGYTAEGPHPGGDATPPPVGVVWRCTWHEACIYACMPCRHM